MTFHVLFYWNSILCQPGENTNPQTWNQTSNWYQAPKTTCIFWRKDVQKTLKLIDIGQVMHYSPKQYQYFYKEILKHPDWQLVGTDTASNRFNWGLEVTMCYVHFVHVHIYLWGSSGFCFSYFVLLWWVVSGLCVLWQAVFRNWGSFLFCFSKLMWYI